MHFTETHRSMQRFVNHRSDSPADTVPVFDPFGDLLLAQRDRPPDLMPVDLVMLTPFQRALLAIDGTVTTFIEAYTLEPVEVTRLRQDHQILETDQFWLEAAAGTPVIARQVLLRGRRSARLYAYAVSLLLPARLPTIFTDDLAVEAGGLGKVLLHSHIENRRDMLWYGCESSRSLPADLRAELGPELLSRTYRILTGGCPAMLINEKFPMYD
jgi:chorismate-pyruvate lyase